MREDEPRLAELLGSLSLATDLAAGLAPETALRSALVAVRLGAAAGIQGFELRDVYYTGVLRFIGCTAFAHEMSSQFGAGDDLRLSRALTTVDPTRPVQALTGALRGMNPEAGLLARASAFARFASHPEAGAELATSHCDLAVRLAGRLGMGTGVIEALGQIYERWDGKGSPLGARGDAIRSGARVLHLAWRIAAHGLLAGPAAAATVISDRAGTEFDPRLAAIASDSLASLVAGFDEPSVWERYLEAEPRPWLRLAPHRIADVALAFGQYVDVKSPYTLGHSTGVADLVKDAAGAAGYSETEQSSLQIAALLHDLGRVSVANGIWDKRGKLGPREWDIVRGHTYQTERILSRSPLLASYAKTASLHHERLDGTGYHRSAEASALDRGARLLAAADVYQALTEERAYRRAHPAPKAASTLAEEARAGRLCREAVEAVLAAAGHRKTRVRGSYPAQLSDREVDVIALVARGLSNKEVAERLSISHKTVQRHMESIFAKTGVRSRAAAAVFAVDQRLVTAR